MFSKGFICPKGSTLKQLYEDPDRLRKPVVRRGFDDDGAPIFEEVEWDEAFAVVGEKFAAVKAEHGNEAVGVYLGNPNAHNLAWNTHARAFLQAVGSRSMFSASTVDQMLRHVASGYLYGNGMRMPVPDLDRTDLLVLLGTNPFVSNGSIYRADFPGRIRAVRDRGGTVVVIDPSRTRTAEAADEHIAIRPGTDAVLLAAIVHRLIGTDQVSMGRVAALVDGMNELRDAVEPFSPEYAELVTGIDAETIERLADDIARAPTAAVHGRIGTTTVEFGTLTTWLIDVIAILTGNLDEPGGSMFPRSAIERVRPEKQGRPYRTGRWQSRVNANPEIQGELPAADLPVEILEPGEGQLRMMFTVAGNPVLSCPDSEQMNEAFASLDAMVSIDIYLNETTRHADVVLPPASALEKSHFDIAFSNLSVRNVANYSAPVFDSEQPAEDDIIARLALLAMGTEGDATLVHDQLVNQLLSAEVGAPGSPVEGRNVEDLIAMVDGDTGSDRMLDAMLRTGPHGDAFGENPDGLSLQKLRDNPHGIDLGALEPRLPAALQTPEKRIDLFAGPFLKELTRLEAAPSSGRVTAVSA